MVDAFANLIPDAQGFLVELSANNNRDWFNANKAIYESMLKALPCCCLIRRPMI